MIFKLYHLARKRTQKDNVIPTAYKKEKKQPWRLHSKYVVAGRGGGDVSSYLVSMEHGTRERILGPDFTQVHG
jgi:hypothetical protein